MALPIYMLSVFYSDAKKQAADLAKILPLVKKVSGNQSAVIQYDDRSVAYLFFSSMDEQALREAFRPVLAPKLQILIVRVASIVGSNIPNLSLGMFEAHLIAPQR
jgi:hypothetical protein